MYKLLADTEEIGIFTSEKLAYEAAYKDAKECVMRRLEQMIADEVDLYYEVVPANEE